MNDWSLPRVVSASLLRNSGVKSVETQRIQIRNGRKFSKEGSPAPIHPTVQTTLHRSILSTYYVTRGAEDSSMKYNKTNK